MGILDKIEDKLSGNKHNADSKHEKPLYSGHERKSLEKQAERQAAGNVGYGSSASGPPYGSGHSGTNYGTGQGSRAEELRHPVQASTGGQYGDDGYGRSGQGYGGTTGGSGLASTQQGYGNDGYGQQSGYGKDRPVDPVDPRSTKGQNALANASHSGRGHGATGEPGRDYDGVDRSRHGGNNNGLTSGPHSSLENRDAIPIAGGEPVGSGGYSGGHNQHHYGRDAALAGGAAALGEREHRRHDNDLSRGDERHHQARDGYGAGGVSSADQYGGENVGSRYTQDTPYTDTGRHGGAGTAGIGGYGTGNEAGHSGHHGHHGHHEGSSGGHRQEPQGVPTERKMGGAYEAGYRDAMAHLEAERR